MLTSCSQLVNSVRDLFKIATSCSSPFSTHSSICKNNPWLTHPPLDALKSKAYWPIWDVWHRKFMKHHDFPFAQRSLADETSVRSTGLKICANRIVNYLLLILHVKTMLVLDFSPLSSGSIPMLSELCWIMKIQLMQSARCWRPMIRFGNCLKRRANLRQIAIYFALTL